MNDIIDVLLKFRDTSNDHHRSLIGEPELFLCIDIEEEQEVFEYKFRVVQADDLDDAWIKCFDIAGIFPDMVIPISRLLKRLHTIRGSDLVTTE